MPPVTPFDLFCPTYEGDVTRSMQYPLQDQGGSEPACLFSFRALFRSCIENSESQ